MFALRVDGDPPVGMTPEELASIVALKRTHGDRLSLSSNGSELEVTSPASSSLSHASTEGATANGVSDGTKVLTGVLVKKDASLGLTLTAGLHGGIFVGAIIAGAAATLCAPRRCSPLQLVHVALPTRRLDRSPCKDDQGRRPH